MQLLYLPGQTVNQLCSLTSVEHVEDLCQDPIRNNALRSAGVCHLLSDKLLLFQPVGVSLQCGSRKRRRLLEESLNKSWTLAACGCVLCLFLYAKN